MQFIKQQCADTSYNLLFSRVFLDEIQDLLNQFAINPLPQGGGALCSVPPPSLSGLPFTQILATHTWKV